MKSCQDWTRTKCAAHLIAIKSFHVEMKLPKAAEPAKQKPPVVDEEDSDFVFDVRLLAGTTHDVARDVN